jgi:tripartite-type tricarboxylate transporter receptor subunit TctC
MCGFDSASLCESFYRPVRRGRCVSSPRRHPGGAPDILARLIGPWLSERLGQQFVVENRPGSGTNIGTEAAVRASPDGYTMLMVSSANAINATLYDKLNFVTVPEFIAHAKANPGKISLGSPGIGTPGHVAGELFKMMAGVDLVHVPYRGGGPVMTDLLGGQVQVLFGSTLLTVEHRHGSPRGDR